MSGTKLVQFGSIAIGDLASIIVPGAGTFSHIANEFLKKKGEKATDVTIRELSNGYHGEIQFDALDADPIIIMALRMKKAISEGASINNIRFLAQVIAGLKKKKALKGDVFRRWASIVESLNRDELLTVGLAYKCYTAIRAKGTGAPNTFWNDIQHSMLEAGYSRDEIGSILSAVARTGLLAPVSAYSATAYHGTQALLEIGELIDLKWSEEE